jgi:DNA-binding GntR family transcriptional regulator
MRQRVLDQIRKRDAPAAMKAMSEYLQQVADYLISESAAKPAPLKTKKKS